MLQATVEDVADSVERVFGVAAADAKSPVVIDLDATLVTANSEKELAAGNFKRGYGFHPLCLVRLSGALELTLRR